MLLPEIMRPDDLPDFERPPVIEVALTVQFAPISALNSARMGILWNKLRSTLPLVSEQTPLPAAFETFGGLLPETASFQFQALFTLPTPRLVLEAENRTELLQVQSDRLSRNWRKQENSNEYPRYENIREKLWEDLQVLSRFLAEEGIDQPIFNQCEATYVNMVKLPDGTSPHIAPERVTPLWSGVKAAGLGEFENAALQVKYVLGRSSKPYGRSYVNASPVHMAIDASPAIRLEITARGKPEGDDLKAAFALLDRHRETIVRTFDAVTSPELHEFWGKKHG